MHGHVNIDHASFQADLFKSGLAAQIGANAFIVWCAIKGHSDYNNGVCYPGIRRLMAQTGLASATVQKAVKSLEEFYLLRSWRVGNKRHYIARERLDVKIGDRVLCTIVVDYVPGTLRKNLKNIKSALENGKADTQALAKAEIIPGTGFTWDASTGVLRATIPASEIAKSRCRETNGEPNPYARTINDLATRTRARRSATDQKVSNVSAGDTR